MAAELGSSDLTHGHNDELALLLPSFVRLKSAQTEFAGAVQPISKKSGCSAQQISVMFL